MADAAIYARFSSDKQRSESIEDQVRVCTEEAGRNGDRIVRVYADRATSGTSTDHRAAFAEMVADSARGLFEKVYVYKTDRFARNRYDSAIYKSKLKRNGVRVVSATEHIEDGPDGILLEAVLEGMAEYYSANLAQNVRRGMRGNALKCRHNGVSVYGYDRGDDGHYHVNEGEALVVRTMFDMCDRGCSLPEIVDALAPWRRRSGKPFIIQDVSRMLRNEKYAGVYSFDGVRVEGGMPAIVDPEQFGRVQWRLVHKTKRGRAMATYLLRGKLFDSEGHSYRGSSGYGKSGRKFTYYRCPETGHLVRRERVEAAVIGQARAFLAEPGAAERAAALFLEDQERALADDLAAMESLRDRLAENEREQARMVDLAAKTGATDAVARKLDDLLSERAAVESELAELERGTPVFDREQIEFWVREMATRAGADDALISFVKRAVINRETDELSVEFVFGGDGPRGGGGGGGSPDGDGFAGTRPWGTTSCLPGSRLRGPGVFMGREAPRGALPLQVVLLGEARPGGREPVKPLAPVDEVRHVRDDGLRLAHGHHALRESADARLGAVGEVDLDEGGAQQRVGAADAQLVEAVQRPARGGHAVELVEQKDAREVRPGAFAVREAREHGVEGGLVLEPGAREHVGVARPERVGGRRVHDGERRALRHAKARRLHAGAGHRGTKAQVGAAGDVLPGVAGGQLAGKLALEREQPLEQRVGLEVGGEKGDQPRVEAALVLGQRALALGAQGLEAAGPLGLEGLVVEKVVVGAALAVGVEGAREHEQRALGGRLGKRGGVLAHGDEQLLERLVGQAPHLGAPALGAARHQLVPRPHCRVTPSPPEIREASSAAVGSSSETALATHDPSTPRPERSLPSCSKTMPSLTAMMISSSP